MAHSTLAYFEAPSDERDPACGQFLHRGATWFH
jgi:hypothetical protein